MGSIAKTEMGLDTTSTSTTNRIRSISGSQETFLIAAGAEAEATPPATPSPSPPPPPPPLEAPAAAASPADLWWQTNQPVQARTATCPAFLRQLSAKDVGILSTPDAAYATLPWARVRAIVARNELHRFQRAPSQLYRYLEFNAALKRQWGSVIRFVLQRRLGWEEEEEEEGEEQEEKQEKQEKQDEKQEKELELDVGGGHLETNRTRTRTQRTREERTRLRFTDPEANVKILWNDWPYGIDERIVHLVVWTKFVLEDDEATGDLRDDVRAEIQSFVDRTFVRHVGEENVIWFKNWSSLKSVHAVEHFHVMLFDPDPDFVDRVTGGDVPLSRKV
ncbi:hypothetical protein PVAG01_04142 [Phlyctema vagabunda]|uniref:N-acetylglucosamine-induced protein 1 n=1 Tax=Phlyctema vagabunda TaxID=108571 RepID=A0ABR4PNF4_9HELO